MDIGWKRQKRSLMLGRLQLEPGNGYTKGSFNIDATLLDWSSRGGLQAKVTRDMIRAPINILRILPDKACIDQPRRAGLVLLRG
jgi:hypothetical protein